MGLGQRIIQGLEASALAQWANKKIEDRAQRGVDERFIAGEYNRLAQLAELSGSPESFSVNAAHANQEYLDFVAKTGIDAQHLEVSESVRNAWMYAMYELHKKSQKMLTEVLSSQLAHETKTANVLDRETMQQAMDVVKGDLIALIADNPRALIDFHKNVQTCARLGAEVRKEEAEIERLTQNRAMEKKEILDPYAKLGQEYDAAKKGAQQRTKSWELFKNIQKSFAASKQAKIDSMGHDKLKKRAKADLTPEDVADLLGLRQGLHLRPQEFLAQAQAAHGEAARGDAKLSAYQQQDGEALQSKRAEFEAAYARLTGGLESVSDLQAQAMASVIDTWMERLQRGGLTAAEAGKVHKEMTALDEALARKSGNGSRLRNHTEVVGSMRNVSRELGELPESGYFSKSEMDGILEMVETKVCQRIAEDVVRLLKNPSSVEGSGSRTGNATARKDRMLNYFRVNVLHNEAFPSMAEASIFLSAVLEKVRESSATVTVVEDGVPKDVRVWELEGQNIWLAKWDAILNQSAESVGSIVDVPYLRQMYANMDLQVEESLAIPEDTPVQATTPPASAPPPAPASRPAPAPDVPELAPDYPAEAEPSFGLDESAEPEESPQSAPEKSLDNQAEIRKASLAYENVQFFMQELLKAPEVNEGGEVIADAEDSAYRRRVLVDLLSESEKIANMNGEAAKEALLAMTDDELADLDSAFFNMESQLPQLLEIHKVKGRPVERVQHFYELSAKMLEVLGERGLPIRQGPRVASELSKKETKDAVNKTEAEEAEQRDATSPEVRKLALSVASIAREISMATDVNGIERALNKGSTDLVSESVTPRGGDWTKNADTISAELMKFNWAIDQRANVIQSGRMELVKDSGTYAGTLLEHLANRFIEQDFNLADEGEDVGPVSRAVRRSSVPGASGGSEKAPTSPEYKGAQVAAAPELHKKKKKKKPSKKTKRKPVSAAKAA